MKTTIKILFKIALVLMSFLPFYSAIAQTNCQAPVANPATNITSNSATLSWTISGTSLNTNILIRYRLINAAGSPWDTIPSGGVSYNLINLFPASPYEYQVARYCINPNGVAFLSAWSNSVVFTTLPSTTTCPTPTGLSTTNITSTSALLNWQPALVNNSYNVRYRIANTVSWTVITVSNTSFPLSNLLPSTMYEWQVRTICSNSTPNTLTSPYSASVFFTTTSGTFTCNAPTNLFETNITNASATLNWNSTGATSYRIRYKLSTTTTWSYKSSSTNSKAISGLLSGSVYTWQVRSICTSAGNISTKSTWSVARTFTTLVQSNCPAPQTLTVGNITSTAAFAIWSPVSSAANYQFSYRMISTSNPNTAWINITTSTTTVALQNLIGGSVYECRVRSNCFASGTNGAFGPWSASVLFTTPVLISVHPNPSSEQVIFTVTSEERSTAQLQVFDFTGNPIRELNSNLNMGENKLNLDVTQLNNGIYTYQFTQGIQTSRGKFIVKH
ncbi:MAG: fibronectin type III domain-containing protein [Bacteroidetes bacterium]|nr:fibronectin type III domain-containing protein [Bacteroidota bacterium]